MKRKFIICLKLVLIVSLALNLSFPPFIKGGQGGIFEYIISASVAHQIDPALIAAVIAVESNFNPNAHSNAGAKGLMQINSVTARYLKVKDIFDPSANIHAGTRYLSELSEKFNGDTKLMLAAYNAGPGAVKKFKGVPPYRETRKYIKKVMDLFEVYKSQLPS